LRGLKGRPWMARTPRGGMHLYFATPSVRIPCSVGRLTPGVDVRSDGGYVVIPPSTGRRWSGERGELPPPPDRLIKATTASRAPSPRGESVLDAGDRPDRRSSLR